MELRPESDEQEIDEDDWIENPRESEVQDALRKLTEIEDQQSKIDHKVTEYDMAEIAAHAAFWDERDGKSGEKTPKLKSKKFSKKTESTEVLKDWEGSCCEDDCVQQLPMSFIIKQRKMYWDKDQHHRKDFLLNNISASKVLDTDKRHGGRAQSEKKHLIEGLRICIKAWCIVYGIAKTCYYESAKEVKEKEAEVEEETKIVKGGRSRSPAFDFAEAWFRTFTVNADFQPNSDVKHLPACLTKAAVYKHLQGGNVGEK
ncbi:hypothetical protein OS493_035341 [Desmophyllum pertusum]|uniref:Uncharacterized protein n=1 Tax=Desmophyllum pertusum TaxID=174260 RepID=A0A9W9Y7R8_9CNID|nr:hypothetical protein OS493_035341 [Desmophyllum pertusum]